jgi:hypothetical protein
VAQRSRRAGSRLINGVAEPAGVVRNSETANMARQIGQELIDRMKNLNDSLEAVASTPDAASTPSEGTRQEGCTLTDAEREAIAVAAEAYSSDHGERFAAILRGLLERTK